MLSNFGLRRKLEDHGAHLGCFECKVIGYMVYAYNDIRDDGKDLRKNRKLTS
jgi:hypothetical protein